MSDWAEQALPRNHPMRHRSRGENVMADTRALESFRSFVYSEMAKLIEAHDDFGPQSMVMDALHERISEEPLERFVGAAPGAQQTSPQGRTAEQILTKYYASCIDADLKALIYVIRDEVLAAHARELLQARLEEAKNIRDNWNVDRGFQKWIDYHIKWLERQLAELDKVKQ